MYDMESNNNEFHSTLRFCNSIHMRNWRIITTLCFVVFCFVSSVNAQDTFKGTTISTIPNAEVYPVPKGKYYPSSSRGVYDYVNNERVKRISKPQEMEVVCYTNCSPSVVYDTYVAILKGKQYYVPISSVEDNHLIEDANGILSATYEEKLNAVRDNEQLHRAAYEMILLEFIRPATDTFPGAIVIR